MAITNPSWTTKVTGDPQTATEMNGIAEAVKANAVVQLANTPGIYMAYLSQTGTNDPTAGNTVQTLSGTPALARTGVGVYTLTITGAFTANKTFFQVSNIPYNKFVTAYRQDANTIGFAIVDSTNTAQDVFTNLILKVEVWP